MLRRLALALLLCGHVVTLSVIPPSPAWAETGPVTCTPPSVYNPRTGTCTIVVTDPGNPGGPGNPGSPGNAGSPENAGGPMQCYLLPGEEVPCRDGDSWWSTALGFGCYVKLSQPQPPKTDPVWEGHTNGAIYVCYSPLVARNGGAPLITLWSATPPAGPTAPPDPAALARKAIAVMQLHAIRIGIVPESRPGSVGIIGMPTWMWAENPDQQTWGPITRSASTGGFTVTATATVDRVVWAMGDGATITCTGPGTPYADSHGKKSSPTCGHTYTRQGTYTVRATSYWTVRWNGLGQSGTIPLDFTDTTNITMGEAQVLNN